MTTYKGYVLHNNGEIYVQRPADNHWGFELCDDDQTWPGGIGLGAGIFEAIQPDDPRISAREHERLDWLL